MSQTFIHISGVYSMTILNAKINTHLDYTIGFETDGASNKMLPHCKNSYDELVKQLVNDREVAMAGLYSNWYQGLVILDVQSSLEQENCIKTVSISSLDELDNFIDYVTKDLYRAKSPSKFAEIIASSTEKVNEFFTTLAKEHYFELRISGTYSFTNDTDELLGEEEKNSQGSASVEEGTICRQFICSLRFVKGLRRLELEPDCHQKLIDLMHEMQRNIHHSQNSRFWDAGAVVFEKNLAFATQDAVFLKIHNTQDLQRVYDLLELHLARLRRSSPIVIFRDPVVINDTLSNDIVIPENPQEISRIDNSCFSKYFKCLRQKQQI